MFVLLKLIELFVEIIYIYSYLFLKVVIKFKQRKKEFILENLLEFLRNYLSHKYRDILVNLNNNFIFFLGTIVSAR